MAISVQKAQKGMLVAVVPIDTTATKAQFYKDSAKKNKLYTFDKGKYVGKIVDISVTNNTVKIQFPIRLKLGLLVYSFGWVSPLDLGVVPSKDALPTNVGELKTLYVLPGKTDVLVRRTPISGVAFAAVNGNQMLRATGQEKSGYTEIVTDNGLGWVATKFLTTTKPATVVVAPQPPVQQPDTSGGGTGDTVVPGVVYVPVEKPVDNQRTIFTVLVSLFGAGVLYKIFKPKTNKP